MSAESMLLSSGKLHAPELNLNLTTAKFETYTDDRGTTQLLPVCDKSSENVISRFVKGNPKNALQAATSIELRDAIGQNFVGDAAKLSSHYIAIVKDTLLDGSPVLRAYPISGGYVFSRKQDSSSASAERQVEVYETLAQYGDKLTVAGKLRQKMLQQESVEAEETAVPGKHTGGRRSTIVRPVRQADMMRDEFQEDDDNENAAFANRREDGDAADDVIDPVAGMDEVLNRLTGANEDPNVDMDDGGRVFEVFGGEGYGDEVAIDYDAGHELGDDAGDAGDIPDEEPDELARKGYDEDDALVGGAILENQPVDEDDLDFDSDVDDPAALMDKALMEKIASTATKEKEGSLSSAAATTGLKRPREKDKEAKEAESEPKKFRLDDAYMDLTERTRQRVIAVLRARGNVMPFKEFAKEFPEIARRGTHEFEVIKKIVGECAIMANNEIMLKTSV